MLLQNVSLNDQIGHLYVVDIKFDHTKATEKQIVYNEIYPPIIEKQKIIDPCERSVYQTVFRNKKGNSRTYRATKKAHATLFKKNSTNVVRTTFFAINRVGCSVTFTYIYTIHLNKSASKKSLF